MQLPSFPFSKLLHFCSTQMSSLDNQSKTSNHEDDCLFAIQLVGSSVMPMVMQVVSELNVLEIIANAGKGAELSPVEISSHLPTQNPDAPIMLDRMLRLLANYSLLSCSTVTLDDGHVERRYGLAPVCKYFVANDDGVSLLPWMSLFHDSTIMRCWYGLKDAVLEGGIAFSKVHGIPIFDFSRKNPQFNQVFNDAMVAHTAVIMKKILEAYKGFENLREVIDVGGGVGTCSDIIISKYPTIKCVNFDLPHVLQTAPPRSGIEHVEGDMFTSIPKGDTIFMKWMLHAWDDADCLKLLKNCYEALPDNGMVIVVEMVIPTEIEQNDQAKAISQLDVIVMAQTQGGKERTEKEFETLAEGAGFDSIKHVCCCCNNWVMEFHKMTSH